MKRDRAKERKENELPISLPALPERWAWANVGQLAQAGEQAVLTGPFGSTLGREDFISTGVPLLTIGCLTESGITLDKAFFISPEKADDLHRYRVRTGDLLFSRSASVGRAGIVSEALDGSIINYHLMRLRLDTGILDPRLFIYYVRGSATVVAYLRAVNHGATRDGINTTDLLGMPVAVPPRSTQHRIVSKIDELFSDLDAGVAALERAKANLKRYRASILKAAVDGSLTAEWRAKHPDVEPASKLLERILAERRKKWEADQLAKFKAAGKEPPKNWRNKYVEPKQPDTTNLPDLPKGWCWASVEQVGEFARYGSSAKTNLAENGVPVLRMGNIVDGSLDLSDLKYLPSDHSEFPFLLLEPGDLLFNRTNSAELVGKSAVYCGIPSPCSYASYLIAVRCITGCDSRFLCMYINSAHGRQWVKSVVSQQVGQANVNGTKLQALAVPLPPLDEQAQIISEVAEKLSQIEAGGIAIEHGLLRGSRLRQSILKQAFEGKLVPQDPHDEPADRLLASIGHSSDQQKRAKTRISRQKVSRG